MILNATSTIYNAIPVLGLMHHMLSQAPEEGWLVPDVDGKPYWMSRETFERESQAFVLDYPVVNFYLHTRSNPSEREEIILNDIQSLERSSFHSEDTTIIVIHGWKNTYSSPVNTLIREAYLTSGRYNVINVDWSTHAGSIYYPGSRNAVPHVGRVVAEFVDFLNRYRLKSLDDVVIVGHSLGAHVSGFAGKRVKSGRVKLIIGLDPAYPLFSYSDCASRLCDTDAKYVETIHTCGGYLGFLQPIGHSSFYPNGGVKQPGCGLDLIGTCAHSRAYEYYAEAVEMNDFNSVRCKDYQSAVGNVCGSVYSGEKMGWPEHLGVVGVFYVPLNSKPPYGMSFSFSCACRKEQN